MRIRSLVVSLVFVACVSSVLSDEISKWDPRMAVEKASVDTNGVKWIDGRYLPLEGRAFDDTEHYYDRLPSNVTANVNGGVRSMKHHTAGMQFRFRTDSPTLTFEWVPYSDSLAMNHMPSTGVSGIDVYRFDEAAGKWCYVRTGQISDRRRGTLRIGWKPGDACLVNLPLYNGVRSFRLGLATNATVSALGPRKSGVNRPVVFYGTSITHGGCSSRPGMSWVNIVGRDLDVPVVNLGFSGSGRMEYEMSEHLARIDASCYVLDCLWNMNCCRGAAGVQDEKDVAAAGCGSTFTDANTRIYFQVRYEPFIRNLRRLRPGVPIVMAEQCDVYAKGPNFKDRFIRALYEKLIAEGWTNLVYLPKTDMYNGDCEGTVDGCHPNDWGMMSMARAFGGAVKEALDRAAHTSPPPPPGPEGWAFRKELAEDPPPDFAPPTGTPWLENRISRCFFSPIKRPPFNRDELKDDIDYYPDNYLERLRREGVNGLWLSLALDDLDEASLAKLRKTVAKCGTHGIKVWAFGIEPKGRPHDHPFFLAHPEARGARSWDGKHVNCPSSPALLAELEEKVSRLFRAVPDLAGMINIANGERATTCLSSARPTVDCPEIPCAACSKRAPWELYADVATAFVKGMRQGNPQARLITWFYHPEPAATRGRWVYECVRHVPDGAEIQYNFESGAEREQLGKVRHGGDYWLSFPGPAEPFRRMADAARAAGAPIAAKIQTSCSHECATVPYVPVPGLLYRKFKGMREAGVRDVMMCWYFGNAPGLMNRAAGLLAYEDFSKGEEAFLKALAEDEWGEDAAVMGDLWKKFSDAYSHYPLSNDLQYYGPFHAGFSWPLYPDVSMRSLQRSWKPMETPGGDLMGEALSGFTLDEACRCAEAMVAELKDVRPVLARLRAKYAADKARRRDLGVMLTLLNLFESSRDIFRFYVLRRDAVFVSRIGGDHARARACADEMADIIRRESEISREMMPLCDDDSRLGFHSEAQAHQFTSAYLRWRCGELDRAAGELAAIRTALAAGKPWPESARERTAVKMAATELPDGSLELSGKCPELAEGLGMELRTYDLCGTAPARVYDVRPTNGAFRIVLPATDWKDDARLKPAWAVVRQGRDYNNGGTTWAFPDVPMFPEPRLNQAALTGDNFARLVVESRMLEKRTGPRVCSSAQDSTSYPLAGAVIVPAKGNAAGEALGQKELALHLRLVSGCEPVMTNAPGRELSFIFARPDGVAAPGPYEAHYRIDGNRVWFWGDGSKGMFGTYKGAAFAVYEFLERRLGIRWVFPGEKGIVYRQSAVLALPAKEDHVYRPPLRMEVFRVPGPHFHKVPWLPILPDFMKQDPVPPALRETDAEIARSCRETGEWQARQRLFSTDSVAYGHAFTKWQPRFAKSHPEFLALNEKGVRGSPGYDAWIKICVSNPAVIDQVIADWKERGCPKYLNVCENDGSGFCRCPGCLALDCPKPGEEFNAHKTDRYLWFANRVTEKAMKIRPDVQVTTYIYAFYRHVPRRERIEYPDNMVFGAVPSIADDTHRFFEDWKAVGMKRFFLRPNFHTTLAVLPGGTEKRIYDIFQDGRAHGLMGVDFDAYIWRNVLNPQSYVTGRMIGHPEMSFEALMDEFCSAYGAAAPDVRAYYERIRARYEADRAASSAATLKKNLLDDSQLISGQARMHSLEALNGDLALLKKARGKALSEVEASRLDDLIVRAECHILAYRLFDAGRDKKNKAAIADAARKLIQFRIDHREALADMYEQVMNYRGGGSEGALYKLVPEVLKEFGGLTPRPDGKEYGD